MSAGSTFGFGPRLTPEDIARLMQQQAADPRADMPVPGALPTSFLTAPRDPDGGFFIPPGVRATAPAGDPSGLRPGDLAPAMPGDPQMAPPSLVGAQMPTFGFGAPATSQPQPAPLGPPPQNVVASPPTFGFGARPAAPQAAARPAPEPDDGPAPMTVPLPPMRPMGIGVQPTAPSQADMPAVGAVPASGQAPADNGLDFGKLLGKLSDAGIGDQLIGLGTGLMTTKGFGQGVGAGLLQGQKLSAQRSASDLARSEYDLKRQKLARETQTENQTARLISGKLGIPIDQAAAFAGNSAFVNGFLNNNYGTPPGWTKGEDGRLMPVPGGENDPATIRAKAEAQAAGSAAGKPEDTTADQKNYDQAKKDGYTKSFIDYQLEKANASRAQTTVNATVNPILKGLSEQFANGAEAARASADVVRAVQNARSQVDAPGGIVAGKFADTNLALQKIGAAFGVTDPRAIVNTESFRTQIKPIVLETVKGLGAGSGVSNADRDFALQAVGGDINLDPGTIKRVLDITERSARAKVDRHNALSDQMLETQPELKQVAPMLRISVPEAQAAAPDPATGARRLRYDPATGAFH